MPPAGMLAIIALGMVLAYVLPQRIKERSDYGLVRTEDRYSAEMRVVKTTAKRVERPVARPSTNSGEVPLLVTGAARATISALGEDMMSRPSGPLDRAATQAERQRLALRRDRAGIVAERAARARRRRHVAAFAAFVAVVAWLLVGVVSLPVIVPVIATSLLGGVLVAGARAAAAQRRADDKVRPIVREVETAAAATGALRRVTRERASGHEAEPSDAETQAIRVVTSEDLAPLAAPAIVPSPELPVSPKSEAFPHLKGSGVAAEWSPREVPAPAYTLKPAIRQYSARPLNEDDFAASARKAELAVDARAARDADVPAEAPAATGTLDAILARRRQASA